MVCLMSLFLYFNSLKGMAAWYLFELGLKKKKKGYIFLYKGKERKCTTRIRLSMKDFI